MNNQAENVKIESSWFNLLHEEFSKEYFKNLVNFVKEEKSRYKIYPPGSLIFNAFNTTPVDKVKVVILGQDPYHGEGQAHGLCFSVPPGIKPPPSLLNIFKELNSDLGIAFPKHGTLTSWAEQGVLLLNATLTVRANSPGSHQNKGWETFTDSVIKILNDTKTNLVFILWGNYAKAKQSLINSENHLILTAAHPSPFSANSGFFGCKHFSKTNEYLIKIGKNPINWSL
ncbi:MAG: uracil-DNA glycosylase [Bacteroidales bacterium]|jgi:uracil-DNA glycosylase|nr:uracil-DNA glycosylase [Bacteroidales bacterium]HOL97051.1 uracil-DNA glycosylase [Bacteroidales bacterium]HOM35960.1 uracil-DNA glycosylase [Bacteroidales bacterium]HPD23426.1 uracil-DNA glycosylase [Bacteroidales bacterium]HRS99406.1 uracil-DNA glycosylase [Bacteroidales bacterium]